MVDVYLDGVLILCGVDLGAHHAHDPGVEAVAEVEVVEDVAKEQEADREAAGAEKTGNPGSRSSSRVSSSTCSSFFVCCHITAEKEE